MNLAVASEQSKRIRRSWIPGFFILNIFMVLMFFYLRWDAHIFEDAYYRKERLLVFVYSMAMVIGFVVSYVKRKGQTGFLKLNLAHFALVVSLFAIELFFSSFPVLLPKKIFKVAPQLDPVIRKVRKDVLEYLPESPWVKFKPNTAVELPKYRGDDFSYTWTTDSLGFKNRPEMATSRRSAPRVYEVTVRLSDVEPAVWRRLRVSSGVTLGRAARVFAVAMGWSAGRPYAFTAGPLRYEGRQPGGVWEDVLDVRLRQVLPDAGAELEFEYGNGHAWHLIVRLDRLLPPNDTWRAPVCVAGAGGAPPVDVGGPWAYEEWRSGSPDGGARDDITESDAGGEPRPLLRFSPDLVNAELERLR